MTTPEIDNCMEALRRIVKNNAKIDPRYFMCRRCVKVYEVLGITGVSQDCMGIQEGPNTESVV